MTEKPTYEILEERIKELEQVNSKYKQAEQWKLLNIKILDRINTSEVWKDCIEEILAEIKQFTGFQAVAIRLNEGEDFPYYVTKGFPDHFVEAEKYLCTRDSMGEIKRDSNGNPYVECMCGNIICGRTDDSKDFFTTGGSFCSNSTSKLLSETTDDDRQTRTRNRCNSEGYESVGLFPLKVGNEILGLLQLNDKRLHQFTEENIKFFEEIGLSIGNAFSKKRVEDALQKNRYLLSESNKILSTILNHTHVLMALLDPTFNFLWVNKAYADSDQKNISFFPGKNHFKLYPHKENLAIFQKVVATGEPFFVIAKSFEYEKNPERGVSYWDWGLVPIKDNTGKVISLVLTLEEVTARRQMEEKLRQSSKMESIGILAGGVAHDFNNLLFMITGNTELALEDIPEWNPVYENLEEIKVASLRAAGIVKQLLNYSRKTDQTLKPIGAVTIIKNALKFLRSTIPSTVKIQSNLPDADVPIIGDPIQINLIIMNLCTNASQAMQEIGTIKIDVVTAILNKEAAEDYINLSAGNYIKITISDSGPGIAPDIIDKIFDPYFTTKEFGAGSGMGLAVVHGIVKNHNGVISVVSKPGEGATFNILFPVIDELPESKIEAKEDIHHGIEAILFVDDEKAITKMMQQMLEKLGYHVEAELSPKKALDLFKSKPDSFDIVITDMTMPQMTGVKFAEKLKEIKSDIPIILCTGHSSLIDEKKVKQLGINGLVMKPVSKSKIAKTIRDILDK